MGPQSRCGSGRSPIISLNTLTAVFRDVLPDKPACLLRFCLRFLGQGLQLCVFCGPIGSTFFIERPRGASVSHGLQAVILDKPGFLFATHGARHQGHNSILVVSDPLIGSPALVGVHEVIRNRLLDLGNRQAGKVAEAIFGLILGPLPEIFPCHHGHESIMTLEKFQSCWQCTHA